MKCWLICAICLFSSFVYADSYYIFNVDSTNIYAYAGSYTRTTPPAYRVVTIIKTPIRTMRYRLYVTKAQFEAGFDSLTHAEIDGLVEEALNEAFDYEKWSPEMMAVIEALYEEINLIRTNLLHKPVGHIDKAARKKKIKDKKPK